MKAVILNSGIGKRMETLGQQKPKCLIRIQNQETILSRQLEVFIKNGINDFFITTGHLEDKIKDYVDENFKGLNIKYIYNSRYSSTNNIYTLYLVKEIDDVNILLMHGDMVIDERLLKGLLESDQKNAVLVRRTGELPEKDFKGKIRQGKVVEIGIGLFGEDCYSLFPVYKLSSEFYKMWLTQIDECVLRGEVNLYAEDALNKILSQLELSPLYYDDELCMEIDNLVDLETIKKILKDKTSKI